MILAKNETAADYLGIHPNLDLALERITPEFFAALGDERVEILPEKVWCTRYTYDTIPEEVNFFEAHEKFLDIHVMLRGSEGVQIAPPAELTPTEAPLASMALGKGDRREAGEGFLCLSRSALADAGAVPGKFPGGLAQRCP